MYGWQQWGGGQMQGRTMANGGQMWPAAPLMGQYQQDQHSYFNQPLWHTRYQPNYHADGTGVGVEGQMQPSNNSDQQQQQQQLQQQQQQQQRRNAEVVKEAPAIPVADTPLPPLPRESPPKNDEEKTAEELNPKDPKEQERLEQLKQQAQQWQAQQQQWQQFQEQQQQTYHQQMTYQHMGYPQQQQQQQPLHPYVPQQQVAAMRAPMYNASHQQPQQPLQDARMQLQQRLQNVRMQPLQDARMQPQQPLQDVRMQPQQPLQDVRMQPQTTALAPRPALPQARAAARPEPVATVVPSGPQKSSAPDVASEPASGIPKAAPKAEPPPEADTQGLAVREARGTPEGQKPPGDAAPGINPKVQEALEEFERQLNSWNQQFETWRSQNRDHPDRAAYDRYEKQWQAWRDQLVQRHSQMKLLADKQRGISAAEPSEERESRPAPPSIVPLMAANPGAPFGDRAPLLGPPGPSGSRLPRGPRDPDFEDSNSSSMSRQGSRYHGFGDEFDGGGGGGGGGRRFGDAPMEGDSFASRDGRYYDEPPSGFGRPGSRGQFYEDDFGWPESRRGGGGFRGRGRGRGRGTGFDEDREPFGFSGFEGGGRGQFADRLPRTEGERGATMQRGEGFDGPTSRGFSNFDQMDRRGPGFDDPMGRGGPVADRGRGATFGNLRGLPTNRERGFDGTGGPPMRNYTSFEDDDSWDPSMAGGRNFEDPGDESWDPAADQRQGQNVGRGRPVNAFEDNGGPRMAGSESLAAEPGKIPSLLPAEEIRSLRQASTEVSSQKPAAVPQAAKAEALKRDTKTLSQAPSKPEQRGPVRKTLLPTPEEKPQDAAAKKSAAPLAVAKKQNSEQAKQPAPAAVKTVAQQDKKATESSFEKEQKAPASKDPPAPDQKPTSGAVSLYDEEDFTADVDLSDIALTSWQPDPIGRLQKLGTEALLPSAGKAAEPPKKQPHESTADVAGNDGKAAQKARDSGQERQPKSDGSRPPPEDFGAKNVFQYDDCYVFMDDEEKGSEDMELDEDACEENQQRGSRGGYGQAEAGRNQFARGRGQGRGRGQQKGRGRGQQEEKGFGQPPARGRGHPEGRGRGQSQARGRGQAEGRGRGRAERGRGKFEGTFEQVDRERDPSERERGQSSRGRDLSSEREKGQGEGGRDQTETERDEFERGFDRGRGRSERGRGQSERGRGQSERGRGQSERGRGQSGRGRGQFESGRDHSERRDFGQEGRGRDLADSGRGRPERGRDVDREIDQFQTDDVTFIGVARGGAKGRRTLLADPQRGRGGPGNSGVRVPRSGFEEDFPNRYEDYPDPEPRRGQVPQKPRPLSPAVPASDMGSLPPLAIAGAITRVLTADEQNIILRAAQELKALQDMKEKAAAAPPPDDAYSTSGGYGLSQFPAAKRPRIRESRWGDFDDAVASEPQQRGWKEDSFIRDDVYGTAGEGATRDAQQKSNDGFAFRDRQQSWDSYEGQGWTKDAAPERRDSYGQNPNYVDRTPQQPSDSRYYDERDKWVGESGLEIDHFAASRSRQPNAFYADRESRSEYGLAENRISIDYGHKLSVAAVAQQIPSLEAVVPELYSILQPPPMPTLSTLGPIETIDYAHGQKAVSRDDELVLGDKSRERLSPPVKDREFRDGRPSGRYQDRDTDNDRYSFDRGDRTSRNWDRDSDRPQQQQQQQRDKDWDGKDRNRERGDRDRQSGRSRDSDREYPRRRDDSRERSSGYRDYRSGKDHHPTFPIDSSHRGGAVASAYSKPAEVKSEMVLIEDLLSTEARRTRPPRIVIILRGPPGSGKTFVAKLIKDKEVENGGGAPRMLCLDDYFMLECEQIKKDPETGKNVKIKALEYEYEPEMEESYRGSLLKTFKKTVEDGFFPFIIVDAINEKIKYCEEMWSFAKQKGFQVYIAEMDMDGPSCHKRNVHGRSLDEINKMIAKWEATPRHYLKVDVRSLLQDAAITEVEMEDTVVEKEAAAEDPVMEIVVVQPVVAAAPQPKDEVAVVALSKWEKMEATEERLDKLDGLRSVKRKRDVPQSLEDYLQLPDDYEQRESQPGKKRVRWADIEEGKDTERRRAVGFVVGQTDWKKLTDPTHAQRALTRTKYI